MKPPPIVGQTLYSLNVGNAARHCEQKLTPVIVRSVGRKYFKTSTKENPHYLTEYHLDDWRERTEYTANSILYADPKEWEDERDAEALTQRIRKTFDLWTGDKVSLAKLRRIVAILDE